MISFVNAAAGNGNPTTVATATIPACSPGDDLIFMVGTRGATADPSSVVDDNGGTWVMATSFVNGTSNLSLWTRAALPGDTGATITASGLSAGGSACGIAILSGAVIAPSNFSTSGNPAGTEVVTGITTAATSWLGFAIFNRVNDTLAPVNETRANTGPMTARYEHRSAGGSDCALTFCLDPNSGASGDISWSQTDGATLTLVFEVSEAAGSGSTRWLWNA